MYSIATNSNNTNIDLQPIEHFDSSYMMVLILTDAFIKLINALY